MAPSRPAPLLLLAASTLFTATACTRSPPPSPSASGSPSASPATPSSHAPSSSARPTSTSIPEGSGDYSAVLALAQRFKRRELTFDQLSDAIVARKLAVHQLGDRYLLTPAPVPPPGITFDPRMMPKDWEGTFGEVAMAFWLGELTREEYDRLHHAAHPTCPS